MSDLSGHLVLISLAVAGGYVVGCLLEWSFQGFLDWWSARRRKKRP